MAVRATKFLTIKKDMANLIASGRKIFEARSQHSPRVDGVDIGTRIGFHWYGRERVTATVSEVHYVQDLAFMVYNFPELYPDQSPQDTFVTWHSMVLGLIAARLSVLELKHDNILSRWGSVCFAWLRIARAHGCLEAGESTSWTDPS